MMLRSKTVHFRSSQHVSGGFTGVQSWNYFLIFGISERNYNAQIHLETSETQYLDPPDLYFHDFYQKNSGSLLNICFWGARPHSFSLVPARLRSFPLVRARPALVRARPGRFRVFRHLSKNL